MTRIAANANYLSRRFGYEKAYALIKEAGFDALDQTLTDMVRPESPFNNPGWEQEALRVRRAADNAGIRINQTHAPFSYPLDVWEKSPELMPILKRSIEISAIWGAETEIVHPYHHPVYFGHEEEIFEKNMEYYGALIPTAEATGVKVCVENMFQVDEIRKHIVHDTCSTLPEFIRYVDTLNHRNIVACLDVGHIALIRQHESPADFVHGLGHDRLQALHIHDNDLVSDQHKLPFDGQIDWKSVAEALGQIDYQGYFTYETSGSMDVVPDEFVPARLKYMADVARYLVSIIDANRP